MRNDYRTPTEGRTTVISDLMAERGLRSTTKAFDEKRAYTRIANIHLRSVREMKSHITRRYREQWIEITPK